MLEKFGWITNYSNYPYQHLETYGATNYGSDWRKASFQYYFTSTETQSDCLHSIAINVF